MSKKEWDIVIKPDTRKLFVNWVEIWRYRDLIKLFVKRDLTAIYKQTILGPAWFILQPVLTAITFTIVFSLIARLSTNGIPPLLFYLTGIIPWTFFSQSLIKTSNTFIANNAIFSKVYFPRLTVPLSTVIATFCSFLVQCMIIVIALIYYIMKPDSVIIINWDGVLLFPILFLIMALLGLSFGILVSALTTKYRDLSFLISFGVQLLMYMSPVIFPLSNVGGTMRYLILSNPMTSVIETFRYALCGKGELNFLYLAYSLGLALIFFLIGSVMFNKVDKTFTDTV